ncbi:hypothetical protein [Effusibacillus dendaii]|uniref:DUF4025 domain-containing protein n=1 Tax=Effusibacillus dendaii TaxID=2743772 RepID=A0A7I8D4Q0_9BACL|nr:hypothetical protein [Effusibacillus dendaii]BCJ85098.1 hypothetical protein skT53_00830 [Effusibacillus dendaii]
MSPDNKVNQASDANDQALLNTAQVVGQEVSKDVNRLTKDDENPEGALQTTHVQVMDSYREGTIDATIEDSANEVNEIPRTGYEQ